jgi:subtilisin family serine protease
MISSALLLSLSLNLAATKAQPPQDVVVVWNNQASLADLSSLHGDARALAAWQRLNEVAQRDKSLAGIEGLEVLRHYTVVNATLVRSTSAARTALTQRSDVKAIVLDTQFKVELPASEAAPATRAVEASLNLINVPQVWALGQQGAGITVASADTGVQWNHPALINQYRGNVAGNVSHGYHWHDAIHATGSSCGADSAAPCDDNSHGSHTVGTMLGSEGTNQIGVAPQAKWIGCRNMNAGDGSPATYLECMDWFLAPTDAAGANPDPLLAPHVINNSWGCPPVEGCTPEQSLLLETAVNNLRAAGILFVAAAGNSGSSCSTVSDPPSYFVSSLTVGNSRLDGTINGSSSRGPVTADGSNRIKPDLSAPGTSIRSSLNNGLYGIKTGTSMAAPHIAGVAALVMGANPALRRNPEAVEAILKSAVVPMTLTQTCGGIAPSIYPNHVAGHGRIDALAAVQQALLAALFTDGFEP